MAYTSADVTAQRERVEALKDARDSGVRDVTYSDGSRVVYRSKEEMDAALANAERRLEEMIEEVSGTVPATRVRTVRFNTGKGF